MIAGDVGGLTVIMPAYNAARYIADAIESVLAQTVAGIEVLVVDDGSTDETPGIVDRHARSVRRHRQPNQGVAKARNAGIALAHTRYIAFLDADDVWLPEKTERQLEAMAKSGTNHRASSTKFLSENSDRTRVEVRGGRRSQSTLSDLLLLGNTIGTPSTVICERSLLEQAGGFDPAFSQCADWDMWIRLAAITEFCSIDQPLVRYRQHAANMSRDVGLLERDSVAVLEKAFAMPRLSASLRSRRRESLARNYSVLAGSYWYAGQYGSSVRCAIRALSLDIRQAEYLVRFPVRMARRRFVT